MKKLAIYIVVAVLAVSCTPPGRPDSQKPLVNAVVTHQADIPVPLNFNYLPDKSRVEQFSSFRLCEMQYRSLPDATHGKSAIIEFYKKNMPCHDWVLEPGDYGDAMVFKKTTKEDEYARIEVYRERKISTVYILIGSKELAVSQPN